MKKIFICEKCDKEFTNELECLDHESECDMETVFTCYKCGETYKWKKNDYLTINQCHHINMGVLGYGSKLDSCLVEFDICDNCLYDIIDSFLLKHEIFETGAFFDYYENKINEKQEQSDE